MGQGCKMKEFKDSLNELLTLNNMRPIDLSRKLKIDHTIIGDWLNHNAVPKLDKLIKVANFFDCSLDYLLQRSDIKEYSKSSVSVSFFERLNILISERKICPAKVMDDCKISRNQFYYWKHGRIPVISTIESLADYFGCSVDYLVGRSDRR